MSRLSIIEIGERVLKEEPVYPAEEDNYFHHICVSAESQDAELDMSVLIHPFYQFVSNRANWLNIPFTCFFSYFVFHVAQMDEDKAMLVLATAKVIARRRAANPMTATEFITYLNGNVLDQEILDTYTSDPDIVAALHTPSLWSV